MNQKDIKYVSRLKNNVKIYDITTGKEINLIAVLRKEGEFDDWVILGSKDKVAVRLVVQKLSEEQANLRRFKAKKDRDKRLNHSKDYYELLCYSLYITTVDQKDMSATEVTKVYGLRWRIENIFKCWKSQFHIQKLIPKGCSLTKERVEAIIYMMLIFILLLQVTIYNYMIKQNKNKDDCIISVAKLCNYIANNIDLFFENSLKKLFPNIQYYCSYDNRKDRLNYVQKFING